MFIPEHSYFTFAVMFVGDHMYKQFDFTSQMMNDSVALTLNTNLRK